MPVVEFSKIDFKKKRDGVYYKSITGNNSQLCIVRLEKGEKTDHTHQMEQMGYILSGQVEVFIEEEAYTLKPGDAFHIPSNVRHGFNVNAHFISLIKYLQLIYFSSFFGEYPASP